MKNTILFCLLLSSLFSFGQETITYKNGGRIFNSNNQKLSSNEIKDLFASNAVALELYNSGKTKQTAGNILLYGGLSIVVINHLSLLQKAKNRESINSNRNIAYIIGGGLILTAIPIKLGFSKKVKKSVELINEDFNHPKTGFSIDSTYFISNANGAGISISF